MTPRLGLSAALACASVSAGAQETIKQTQQPAAAADPAMPDARRISYPAEFYTQFQPQTALDLLQRTPGFLLLAPEAGDLQRGFSANAGNVLIDGQRPTVKSGGIAAYLGRISAARVARVELIRGALTGEAQGQTLVANLVLVEGGGASGNASFELRRAPADRITPKLEASYVLPLGGWQLSVGLTAFHERNPLAGRYEYREVGGTTAATLDEAFGRGQENIAVNASAAHDFAGGDLTLNGRFEWSRDRYRQMLTPLSGDMPGSSILGQGVDHNGELGADWVRLLGKGWGLKLIGLTRSGTNDATESFAEGGEDSAFTSRNRTVELVARASAYRDSNHWLRPEVVTEIAWNRLNGQFALTENGAPVDLAGSDVQVTEVRGEVAANLSARLTRTLRAEAGIAFEQTSIRVAGESADERTLRFWKPSAALVWDADASTQLRLGWRRTVGQIDLAGFAASGNLIDNRPIAGNADLRPEVTEAWSFKADRRFGSNGGALALTIARETIGDALTFVPLASGGEALLNFGTVDLWRLSGDATLPVDRWLKGARLTANGSVVHARRPDPFGGRRADDRDLDELKVAFRQDLARLRAAYGFTVEAFSRERTWFVAQFEQTRYRPYATAYVETAAVPGFKTTLTVSGITGERERRLRLFYEPDRGSPLVGSERRTRERGAFVNLLLAKQF